MKTIEQHLLEETYRPDRQGKLEDYNNLKVEITNIKCPKTIKNKKTKKAWEVVIPTLCNTKRVSSEDIVLLETAFIALDMLYDTKDALDTYKENNSIETQDFSIINKYSILISRTTNDFLRIMALFGLSPLQKMKLVSGAIDVKTKNTLAEKLTKK